MPKTFKECDDNELRDLVIDEKEMTRYLETGQQGPSIRKALARSQQALDADQVQVRRCKECGCLYSVPIGNAFGMQKLGGDDGVCWTCKGAYDDPEGFIKP